MLPECLKFYYDLAFNESQDVLLSDFLNNSELLEKGFDYNPDYDCYLFTDLIKTGEKFELYGVSIDRNDFAKNKLKVYKNQLFDYLYANNFSLKDEEKIKFFNNIFDEIYLIFKKINISSNENQAIIQKEVNEVVEEIYSLYGDVSKTHKLFRSLLLNRASANTSRTYFGLKPDIKKSFLVDLYDLCVDLFLIDDTSLPEEDFIEVFSCTKPSSTAHIQFVEKNYSIVVLLEGIQSFFENLNFMTIEKSQMFSNKQNKLLSSNDMYAVKSRNKNNQDPLIEEINERIEELKSTHLK